MARPSSQDPIEKFRFQVFALTNGAFKGDNDTAVLGNAVTNGSAFNFIVNAPHSFSRAGFTDVTLPKATISEMLYRENVDGNYFRKTTGLVRFEPVTLKRGVTADRELYDWYTLVNNDADSLNAVSAAATTFLGATSFQNPIFRKDIIISVTDRTGVFVKHWVLFNAFPISYKGGDDLDATSDSKLVEELVLTFETFMEAQGATIGDALQDIQDQITKAAEDSIANALIGVAAGGLSSAF
jgi:phage tail-like protein